MPSERVAESNQYGVHVAVPGEAANKLLKNKQFQNFKAGQNDTLM